MRYLWLLLLLALVGYGLTGVVQVRPGERAVVRRFGRVLPNKPEPGLWIGLPWGLDRVDRIAVDKIQSVNVGYMEDSTDDAIPAGQMLTGDHNLVNVQVTIFYHVRPDEVEDYVTHADLVEPLIARVTETVLAQWVAARTVDEVLLNAKTALPRPLKEGVQDRLAEYHVGIEIADARVNLIAPPDAVKSAFDKVVRAQTEIGTRIYAAEQDARTKYQQAEARVREVELTTAAYKERVLRLARSESNSFLARLRQYQTARTSNPNYLRQIWDEEMAGILTNLQKAQRIAPLDHGLHGLGLDLNTMPDIPKK